MGLLAVVTQNVVIYRMVLRIEFADRLAASLFHIPFWVLTMIIKLMIRRTRAFDPIKHCR